MSRRQAIIRRRLVLGGMALFLLLLVYAGVWIYAKNYVGRQGDQVIYHHIYLDDTDVSGMTREEALAVLDEHVQTQGSRKLTMKLEKETMTVRLSELGLDIVQAEKIVDTAFSYGKDGSVFARYRKIKKLEKEDLRLEVTYDVDDEKMQTVLEAKMQGMNKGTVDATISRKNGAFVITDEVTGITVDMEQSQAALKQYFSGDWKTGQATVQLVSTVDQPDVTREDLETIQDVLGTYTTVCGYGGGRVKNIETGASKMDGTLLMPGEEFSADEAMRPYTADNGYAEAGSYEKGKVVQSMGGGICQVSSTLYNAVLLAELEVTQRAPHSMLVSYVKPAMDAAIAGDYKDLKFKNNKETPLYIESYVSGGKITFTIYGREDRDASRSIEYVSETLETKNPDPKYEASDDELGTIKQLDAAHVGKTAKLWKVVYENGKETGREVVNTSKYSSSSAVYSVGTKTDYAKAARLVKDAIKTNKENKIKAAISEAKALIQAEKKQDDKKDSAKDEKKSNDKKKTEDQTSGTEE